MKARETGKKNKSRWKAIAFRKTCIRLIAYVYVFFMVLNRRISVRGKKRLAVSFCSCLVALVMLFSLPGRDETDTAKQETTVAEALTASHNRVTGSRTGASIELNRSEVSGDSEEDAAAESGEEREADKKEKKNRNVVAANDTQSTSTKQPDKTDEQTEVLSPVQALLENNGENKQSKTISMRYQYPVEIGYHGEQNFDGVQSAADYIERAVYPVVVEDTEGEAVEKEAVEEEAVEEEDTGGDDIEEVNAGMTEDAGEETVSGTPQPQEEESEELENETVIPDTAAPVLLFDEEQYTKIQGEGKTIFCMNDNHIQMDATDDADGLTGTGVEKLCYVYGEKLRYCMDLTQGAEIEAPKNFYGQIAACCYDAAGNRSDVWSNYVLVENQAPEIRFSQDTLCTAPYTFWVTVGETGHIVSGIHNVECQVNGESYQITDLTTLENTTLDEGLEVPTQCEFSLPFTEEGTYSVVVTVTDYAGNTSTEEKIVRVTKPELISVLMPEKFAIHIDPQRLAGKEQIYSDDITLENDSDFDVQVTVKKVDVSIQEEVSDTGIRKDCEMYLVAPDTGEKIPLKKGENEEVYSYSLPKGTREDIGKLRFVGDTTEGSDEMWQDSDVVIRVDLDFTKKE